MSALYELSLSDVHAMLMRKECSVTEVVQSCLARIERTEPHLNACVTVLADEALAQAGALDAEGPEAGRALWGVPVTLKDLICTKGVRTTCGSRFLETFVPCYDAEVADRLKRAGAVVLAKTNMDEFAMGSTTEHSAFGRTSNPWDVERVPGGSSGGSAASVAAGQAFASLGSDTGGSIRQPASLCGCVGLKPTYGLVSRFGVVAYGSSFDQVGPLARNVEDCAHLLECIAGPDSKDATSARSDIYPDKVTCGGYLAAARKAGAMEPGDVVCGLRIGVPQEFWSSGISEEVLASCNGLLRKLEEAGAILVPVSMPSQTFAVATYYIMASAEASTNLARFDGIRYGRRAKGVDDLVELYTASRTQGFGPEVQRRIMLGTFVLSSGYYDAYYRKAAQVRRLLRNDFLRALEQCDVLAAPSCPGTAWPFGYFEADPLKAYKMDLLTVALNLVGLPGLSLPVGLGEDSRLPVGIQFMGGSFKERTLFQLGMAAEKLTPALGVPRGIQHI